MSKREELKAVRAEKKHVLDEMSKWAVDSGTYDRLCKAYKKLNTIEEDILNGKKARSWLPQFLTVLLGILTIVGSVACTMYLGHLAYVHGENLDLCDGRIWNLALKLLLNRGNVTQV